MNPLLEKFNTPFSTPPFSKIKNEHFKPAFEKAIALAKKEIDEIVVNPAAPTFENTLVALDFSGELLETISHIFFAFHLHCYPKIKTRNQNQEADLL